MAEKVTLKEFGVRLEEYDSAGAARKAVGRFNGWTEEEKQRARKLIDNYFGEPPVKAKPAAKAGGKRRGRPPMAEKVAAAVASTKVPGRRGRPPKVKVAPVTAGATARAAKIVTPISPKEAARAKLPFAIENVLSNLSVVVGNVKSMHDVQPSLKLQPLLTHLVEAHNATMTLITQDLPFELGTTEGAATAPTKRGRGRPPAINSSLSEPGNGRALALDDDEDDELRMPPQKTATSLSQI